LISNVFKSINCFYILGIGDSFSHPILFAIGCKNWKTTCDRFCCGRISLKI
jgi:hypothetical protein